MLMLLVLLLLLLLRVTHEGCSLYKNHSRTIGKHFFQDEAKNDPDGSAPIGKFSAFCWAQAG